jgi:hypothetical protein
MFDGVGSLIFRTDIIGDVLCGIVGDVSVCLLDMNESRYLNDMVLAKKGLKCTKYLEEQQLDKRNNIVGDLLNIVVAMGETSDTFGK